MRIACLRSFTGFSLSLYISSAPGLAFCADSVRDMPVFTVSYACDSGQQIVVRYDNSNSETPTARLEYKGQTFELYNVRSGSGARYASEQGLAPDRGLQWWTQGNGATLSEMLMDHTAPGPTPIETCMTKSAD